MTDSGTFGDSVYEQAEAAKGAENIYAVENLTCDDAGAATWWQRTSGRPVTRPAPKMPPRTCDRKNGRG